MSISHGPVREDNFPERPSPAARRGRGVFRLVLYVAGLLLTGAGLCSAVFCGIAFHEWDRLEGQVRVINLSLRSNPAGIKLDGRPVTAPEAQEQVRLWSAQATEKELVAFKLLSLSLGLVLGGLVVCLLGWGLRPSGEGV